MSSWSRQAFDAKAVEREHRLAIWSRVIAEFLIAVLLCAAPLFFGGRHEGGRAVFVTLVCAVALAHLVELFVSARPTWRLTSVEPLLLAATGLMVFQLVEWPQRWLDLFSPTIASSLPLWQPEAMSGFGFGEWRTISLVPSATRTSLTVFIAYAVLFLVLAQRARSVEDAARLARCVAVAAAFMAIVGLAQFVSGTDSYLWLYHHPARSPLGRVTGSFTNQNHFAQFIVLGFGPLVWCAHEMSYRAPRAGRHAYLPPLVGAALVVLSVLLSLSRGGTLALGVSLCVFLSIMSWHGRLRRREIAVIATCIVVITVAIGVHGHERLSQRLLSLIPSDSEGNGPSRERLVLWRADWTAARDFPLLGAGAGTHADIYPRYMEEQYNVRFTHAENSYLQVLLETGAAGLCLLATGIVVVLTWCFGLARNAGRRSDAALIAGLCGSVAATFAQAAVDFAWYIPGCMTLVIAILVVLWRLSRAAAAGSPDEPHCRECRMTRPMAGLALAAVGGLSVMMVWQTGKSAQAAMHWDEYLRHSYSAGHIALRNDDESLQVVRELTRLASGALRQDGEMEVAWLRLAALNMRRFDLEQRTAENSIDLAQLRDAVTASNFPTPAKAREWIQTAIGGNARYLDQAVQCAERAARLSPWRGDAYLYLAELSFLRDGTLGMRDRLLSQAANVRPHDGSVAFALGLADLQRGDQDAAFRRWRAMFGGNRELREKLVDLLAPQIGPTMFILAFSPDTESLLRLFHLYQAADRRDEAAFVGERAAPLLVSQGESTSGQPKASLLATASDIIWYLKRREEAVTLLGKAVEAHPNDPGIRRKLAERAEVAEQFELAAEQLRWCLLRAPFDEPLKVALARNELLRRRRLASIPPVESPPPLR